MTYDRGRRTGKDMEIRYRKEETGEGKEYNALRR
jgi:hypothetical protein